MGFVVYVRANAQTVSRDPTDLVEGGAENARVSAETAVALRPDGPFVPIARAFREYAGFRDVFAAAIPTPSLRNYTRLRGAVAVVVALPVVMLGELDRELFVRSGATIGPGRIAIDVLLAAWVIFELSRRTPRMPRVAAVCLVAIALRWSLVATRLCGKHVHGLVWAAIGLAVVGAALFAFVMPSRARVERELLGKLGISRREQHGALAPLEPAGATVAAAVAVAAGLPAVLHGLRWAGTGFLVQACAFVGFAAAAPIVVARFEEPPGARLGTSLASSLSSSLLSSLRRVPLPRMLFAVAAGLALTAAAVSAGRLFFDASAEIAHCVNRLDNEARAARAAESQELARAVAHVRSSAPLVFMTAVVFPFAEERIYRGVLQDVLVRKFGAAYGIFAAALAFGVAHLGVYDLALYQTVLLGLGFGLAYAEGGIWPAFVVHAAWNLLQMG